MNENDVELNIVLSVADEKIASEIVEKVKNGLVSWQELVSMYRGRGVSLYRLRKILLALLHKKKIIELPCRLFTTREYLEKTPREALREEIINKIRELGLQKCGKPVGVTYNKISITISRKGKISVTFHY